MFSQKFLLVGLAVIAAVNADVSHLFNKATGYNYPSNPQPSFHDHHPAPVAPAPQPAPQVLTACSV